MPEPQPLILDNASLKLSPTALETDLVELACVTNHLEITPDVSITTLDTMCGSKDYPGTVKWSLIATLYQSFDPDATEEVLSAAVALGEPVPFEVLGYRDKPVSATNPKWSGTVIPQPYSPINGDAGDASEVELEWSINGAPLKETTDVIALATHAGAAAGGGTAEQADYEAMTVAELQAAAGDRDLATSGTKAELIQRLKDADDAA